MNQQSKRTFAAASKVKRDVNRRELLHDENGDPYLGERLNPIPNIDAANLVYFQHDFKRDAAYNTVMNIDLKSAYATILLRDGFITKETFDYLAKCTKPERLASVGMLAARKNIFIFKDGVAVEHSEVKEETSGVFFYAVQKTYEIMSRLKKICGQKYLFTWVDGIYFLPSEKIYAECIAELEKSSFNFSVEKLKRFSVEITQTKANIKFWKKASNNKYKKKVFQLPLNMNEYQKKCLSQITNHKNLKNETNKSKISGR